MNLTTLQELEEKLKEATGRVHVPDFEHPERGGQKCVPEYTASLDAVYALEGSVDAALYPWVINGDVPVFESCRDRILAIVRALITQKENDDV